MSTEQHRIKELVKERYGARAERVINLTPAELNHTNGDSCGYPSDGACCGVEDLDHAMLLYTRANWPAFLPSPSPPPPAAATQRPWPACNPANGCWT